MPKAPRKDKEPFRWKCSQCKMTGRAKTEADAKVALLMHIALAHGK